MASAHCAARVLAGLCVTAAAAALGERRGEGARAADEVVHAVRADAVLHVVNVPGKHGLHAVRRERWDDKLDILLVDRVVCCLLYTSDAADE